MSDERYLVGRLQQGDRAALRDIYERYKDDLLTVAVCLLGDVAPAEDVLHDMFVAFAGSARELQVRSSLRGYLAACVANRARDQLRKRPREPVPLAEADEFASAAVEPSAAVSGWEESEQLQRALAVLPYEQREAITLHLHGDMTFREIAQHQDVSINTAQSRYRYGLDRLRSILDVGARA